MLVVRRCLPFAMVGMASAWLVFSNTSTGDYSIDAGPAVDALVSGNLSAYLHAHAMMGPFATLVEAPFAALAGGSKLAEYQWACFPCLLSAGFLGLYLAFLAKQRGVSSLSQLVITTLCLANPLTIEALRNGHPEEILTAALVVGAIAVASQGHGWRTATLLGLAIASKQWAVIAILPVLMALPARRVRVSLGTIAIALVLILPGLLAAPASFFEVQGNAASTWRIVDPWNVWYPAATLSTKTLMSGSVQLTAHIHEAPPLVSRFSHPLIVLLALVLPLTLALRRGRVGLSGADAMALFALLALLRCALDPVGNLYYHEPVLLALLGWDALSTRGLPLRGMTGTAVALLFWRWSHNLSDPETLNFAYIAVVAMACCAIAMYLFRRWPVAMESQSGTEAAAGRSYDVAPDIVDRFAIEHP